MFTYWTREHEYSLLYEYYDERTSEDERDKT